MTSNNYYGFTHTGTQYGTTYTPVPTTPYAMTAQMYGSSARSAYDQTAYPQTNQTAPNSTAYSYNQRAQPTAAAVGFGTESTQYPNTAQNTTYPYNYTNSYNSVVTNYAAIPHMFLFECKAALYSQQTTNTGAEEQTAAIYSNNKSSNNWSFKKNMKTNKVKTTKSVQQLHYCD
ncbi:unnamed protein product, partial [Medioppia subpectinata]